MKKIEIEVYKLFIIAGIILSIFAIPLTAMAIHYSFDYNKNCDSHIWNAARSSTPEIAAEELTKAIDYMKAHNLTSGTSTSASAENNVGWYYESLIAARDNLENFHETNTEETYYLELSKATEKIGDLADAHPFYISLFKHGMVAHYELFLVLCISAFIIAALMGDAYKPSTCNIYVPALKKDPIPVENANL